MGHKYMLKNSEETKTGTVAFKENLLWEVTKFLQESLPDKRPITISIDKDDYNEQFQKALEQNKRVEYGKKL